MSALKKEQVTPIADKSTSRARKARSDSYSARDGATAYAPSAESVRSARKTLGYNAKERKLASDLVSRFLVRQNDQPSELAGY